MKINHLNGGLRKLIDTSYHIDMNKSNMALVCGDGYNALYLINKIL